jgi:CubicO group peptidase (beta-lactamase class C family)
MGDELTLTLHVAGAAIACLSLSILLPVKDFASEGADAAVGAIGAAVITPVMRQYGVPGTAVGSSLAGRFTCSHLAWCPRIPVWPFTDNTHFEIGSISKIFNASLTSYARLATQTVRDALIHTVPGQKSLSRMQPFLAVEA